MSLTWLRSTGPRRTLLAFAVTFLAALAVFTAPRFVWNTVRAARAQQPPAAAPVADTAQAAPQAGAPASRAADPSGADIAAAAPRERAPVPLTTRLTGILGIALILAIGYGVSRNRNAIRWSTIAWGLGLQVAFAVFVLRVPFGQQLFRWLGAVVTRILGFS